VPSDEQAMNRMRGYCGSSQLMRCKAHLSACFSDYCFKETCEPSPFATRLMRRM
jgi:hypothetical protein